MCHQLYVERNSPSLRLFHTRILHIREAMSDQTRPSVMMFFRGECSSITESKGAIRMVCLLRKDKKRRTGQERPTPSAFRKSKESIVKSWTPDFENCERINLYYFTSFWSSGILLSNLYPSILSLCHISLPKACSYFCY